MLQEFITLLYEIHVYKILKKLVLLKWGVAFLFIFVVTVLCF